MDSLPTGTMQSWLIVAAIGLSPMLLLFIAEAVRLLLHRKRRERYLAALEKGEPALRPMGIETPPM